MLSLPLLYHELRPERSSYSYVLQCRRFEEHLGLFARMRAEQPHALQPEITFDDGHCSNIRYALPLLANRAMRARFFITAGWTGTRANYMNWEDLRSLHAAGQTIGAHGWSHALLTQVHGAELELELRGAREKLEDGLGLPVTSMSLPGGRSNRSVLEACTEAGYTEVWTSVPRAEPKPFGKVIGRLNVRGDANVAWLEKLLQPGGAELRGLRRQHQVKTAAKALLGDRLYAKAWAMLNREEPENDAARGAP